MSVVHRDRSKTSDFRRSLAAWDLEGYIENNWFWAFGGVKYSLCRWIFDRVVVYFSCGRVIFLLPEGVNLSVRSHGLLASARMYSRTKLEFLWISHQCTMVSGGRPTVYTFLLSVGRPRGRPPNFNEDYYVCGYLVLFWHFYTLWQSNEKCSRIHEMKMSIL